MRDLRSSSSAENEIRALKKHSWEHIQIKTDQNKHDTNYIRRMISYSECEALAFSFFKANEDPEIINFDTQQITGRLQL